MFGTFTFSYSPSPVSGAEDNKLEMSFSSEADLITILKHFENFLRANGYPLDFGDTLKVSYKSEEQPQETNHEFQPLTVNCPTQWVVNSGYDNRLNLSTMAV
jgi:hypothetical protein